MRSSSAACSNAATIRSDRRTRALLQRVGIRLGLPSGGMHSAIAHSALTDE
jgi:hypothetical protein